MTVPQWKRYFDVRSVLWRRLVRWGALNVPPLIEPVLLAWWSFFFLLRRQSRSGVMSNLKAIFPGSTVIARFLQTYRVIWNFACTLSDGMRFREMGTIPDWQLQGSPHLEEMQRTPGGAIILTAHMGSYDLGAYVFALRSKRRMVMVRAPEQDPATQAFETSVSGTGGDAVRVDFNTRAGDLALDLLESLRNGDILAIQGDRVTQGIATVRGTLFGKAMEFPAGPFALAMASGAAIYPMFVIRVARRKYRVLTCPRIDVVRRGRDRDEAINRAVSAWSTQLETVVRSYWYQWFTFEPYTTGLE